MHVPIETERNKLSKKVDSLQASFDSDADGTAELKDHVSDLRNEVENLDNSDGPVYGDNIAEIFTIVADLRNTLPADPERT